MAHLPELHRYGRFRKWIEESVTFLHSPDELQIQSSPTEYLCGPERDQASLGQPSATRCLVDGQLARLFAGPFPPPSVFQRATGLRIVRKQRLLVLLLNFRSWGVLLLNFR